ncbi:MAG: hypothetical protein IKO01_00760 [Kiritimatiellae bacterium]|nr:hypothetical protein [Kiritimatiellia bacterium]MBR4253194.1 hypothetical protein [Kiritimatiellia bacterium]
MKKTRLVLHKATLAALLLAAALAGFCGGFLANAAVIRARVRRISAMPEDMPTFLTERLAGILGLDDAQQAAVRGHFARHEVRMREERQRGRATVDALVAELDAAIQSELTPEQKKSHVEYLEKLREQSRENRQLRRAVGGGR